MAAGMFGAMKFALCILTICTAIIISGFPTTNDAADAANPNDDVVDDENPRTAGSSSTLRYVHAIWRHGDRAPLEKPYPGDMHGWKTFIFFKFKKHNCGDFPPNILTDESFWPRGWGQLTTVGKMTQKKQLLLSVKWKNAKKKWQILCDLILFVAGNATNPRIGHVPAPSLCWHFSVHAIQSEGGDEQIFKIAGKKFFLIE